MKPTKSISWSYPSSPSAIKFRHAKHGCWTVYVHSSPTEAKPMKGFRLVEDAVQYAETLIEPWARWQTDLGDLAIAAGGLLRRLADNAIDHQADKLGIDSRNRRGATHIQIGNTAYPKGNRGL